MIIEVMPISLGELQYSNPKELRLNYTVYFFVSLK